MKYNHKKAMKFIFLNMKVNNCRKKNIQLYRCNVSMLKNKFGWIDRKTFLLQV